MAFALRKASVIYAPSDGLFSTATAFQRGKAGSTGATLAGEGDLTPFYGRDAFQRSIVLGTTEGNPALPAITVQRLLQYSRDSIMRAGVTGILPYVQMRWHECISTDIPTGWKMMIHYAKTRQGDTSIGDAAAVDGADGTIQIDTPLTAEYAFWWWKPSLKKQTTAEAQAANSIKFLAAPGELCGSGYPGPDKIGLMAHDAASAATANISYTGDGGTTWATATATDPFGSNEHAGHLTDLMPFSDTQYIAAVGRITTDGSNPAEVSIIKGSLSTGDIASHTLVNVGSNNGDIITATMWSSKNPSNVYAATDNGTIHKSTNSGTTFAITALSGATQINKIYEAPNGDVYAVGNGNEIYIEADGTNAFTAYTGPTGSNNSTAIAVSHDGILLGNGTKLFSTTNLEPNAAANWTEMYDFGANHSVIEIGLAGRSGGQGGTTQAAFIGVSDATGTNGDVWITPDGGKTMEEVTDLANANYNGFYFSPADDSVGWACGEPVSSLAIVHHLTPD